MDVSPLQVDPFIDMNYNLDFLNDINLDELGSNFCCEFSNEIVNTQSNSILSNNSIIDFDIIQDQDIDLDILLNQNLDIPEDLCDNFPDLSPENEHIVSKSDNNFKVFKKSRKTKTSILPFSIRDIDEHYRHPTKSNLKNEDLVRGKPGDRIYLSKEECEMLIREGYSIPTHLPLTKSEERALKSVRRKIRNKISAKNSRAKKETYVEGLEQRIFLCSKENLMLRQKLEETEQDKKNLFLQINNLKQQLSKFIPHSKTQSTSIMLLLLTFMVIMSPIFDPRLLLKNYNFYRQDTDAKHIFPGRTRVLLQESESSTKVDEPYMVTIRSGPPWQIPPKTPAIQMRALKLNDKTTNLKNISFTLTKKDL